MLAMGSRSGIKGSECSNLWYHVAICIKDIPCSTEVEAQTFPVLSACCAPLYAVQWSFMLSKFVHKTSLSFLHDNMRITNKNWRLVVCGRVDTSPCMPSSPCYLVM